MEAWLFVLIIVILAWLYDFYNGANDCANAIATTVSTRVLSPRQAILGAALLNLVGALFTTKVAETIGKGIVPEEFMTKAVIISAILGAIAWSALATHRGIPVSITHALVGGILGAGLISQGLAGINWLGFKRIGLGMIFSPLGGFLGGLLLILILYWLFQNFRPQRVNAWFGKAQLLSASFMAFTHGTNDAQNAMGVITAALLAGGFISHFKVPLWVILGSALFMGFGTYFGGKKVIKTMGMRMTKIKPIHGFAAETSSAVVILIASLLGIPISTTHTISTAIIGVGSSKRFSAVRWDVTKEIVIAWLLTIPASALAGGVIYSLFSFSMKFLS